MAPLAPAGTQIKNDENLASDFQDYLKQQKQAPLCEEPEKPKSTYSSAQVSLAVIAPSNRPLDQTAATQFSEEDYRKALAAHGLASAAVDIPSIDQIIAGLNEINAKETFQALLNISRMAPATWSELLQKLGETVQRLKAADIELKLKETDRLVQGFRKLFALADTPIPSNSSQRKELIEEFENALRLVGRGARGIEQIPVPSVPPVGEAASPAIGTEPPAHLPTPGETTAAPTPEPTVPNTNTAATLNGTPDEPVEPVGPLATRPAPAEPSRLNPLNWKFVRSTLETLNKRWSGLISLFARAKSFISPDYTRWTATQEILQNIVNRYVTTSRATEPEVANARALLQAMNDNHKGIARLLNRLPEDEFYALGEINSTNVAEGLSRIKALFDTKSPVTFIEAVTPEAEALEALTQTPAPETPALEAPTQTPTPERAAPEAPAQPPAPETATTEVPGPKTSGELTAKLAAIEEAAGHAKTPPPFEPPPSPGAAPQPPIRDLTSGEMLVTPPRTPRAAPPPPPTPGRALVGKRYPLLGVRPGRERGLSAAAGLWPSQSPPTPGIPGAPAAPISRAALPPPVPLIARADAPLAITPAQPPSAQAPVTPPPLPPAAPTTAGTDASAVVAPAQPPVTAAPAPSDPSVLELLRKIPTEKLTPENMGKLQGLLKSLEEIGEAHLPPALLPNSSQSVYTLLRQAAEGSAPARHADVVLNNIINACHTILEGEKPFIYLKTGLSPANLKKFVNLIESGKIAKEEALHIIKAAMEAGKPATEALAEIEATIPGAIPAKPNIVKFDWRKFLTEWPRLRALIGGTPPVPQTPKLPEPPVPPAPPAPPVPPTPAELPIPPVVTPPVEAPKTPPPTHIPLPGWLRSGLLVLNVIGFGINAYELAKNVKKPGKIDKEGAAISTLGMGASGVGIAGYFGWLGAGLFAKVIGIVTAVGSPFLGYWGEGHGEDLIVNDLYEAILQGNTTALKDYVEADRWWAGHTVDDEVGNKLLTKLIENGKTGELQKPEFKYFLDTTINRLLDYNAGHDDFATALVFAYYSNDPKNVERVMDIYKHRWWDSKEDIKEYNALAGALHALNVPNFTEVLEATRKNVEALRQKSEGLKQKAEGLRQKSEVRDLITEAANLHKAKNLEASFKKYNEAFTRLEKLHQEFQITDSFAIGNAAMGIAMTAPTVPSVLQSLSAQELDLRIKNYYIIGAQNLEKALKEGEVTDAETSQKVERKIQIARREIERLSTQ